MKILFITDTLGAGGKERRLTELMQALTIRHDIDFELVVMSRDIHYKAVIDLRIKIHYILRKTKNDLNIFFRLYRLCRNYKPDIVHCWDSMTAIYITPTCKLLGIKLVNGMVMDSPASRNICNKHWLRARLTFPFSDYIVSNSKAGLESYRAPVNRSEVIYNGFNFDRTKSLVDKEIIKDQLGVDTEYLIGMVATFWKKKDYATYYTAAQLVLAKRKDITFLAIGAETDSVESKALVDKKYIENFRFLGKKSGIESFINAMDICILSTFTEGISNSILEYMALEKPVIATKGGGTIEILIDDETGFLIEPSNPEELAGKIEVLLNDPLLRMKMGTTGKERIMKEFSIDQMVNKYIERYEMLMAK